jgi:hypothetical protein
VAGPLDQPCCRVSNSANSPADELDAEPVERDREDRRVVAHEPEHGADAEGVDVLGRIGNTGAIRLSFISPRYFFAASWSRMPRSASA